MNGKPSNATPVNPRVVGGAASIRHVHSDPPPKFIDDEIARKVRKVTVRMGNPMRAGTTR